MFLENEDMNTIEIPFNKFIGIRRSESHEKALLELHANENMKNHLGTVHASAQFALAEACSGEYLLNKFKDYERNFVPVVRRIETKFKNPAEGTIYAKASLDPDIENSVIEKLEKKGRVLIPVQVEVFNSENKTTMTAKIDWFIQKI